MSATKPNRLSSRFRITRVYMLTGVGFLGACWFFMILAAESLSRGRWIDSYLLAAVHLFVIGYAMVVVHGAMLQIVPVAFQGRLYSIRLGYVQYALIVLGAVALPLGFLVHMWRIAAVGGLLLILSTGFLLWNLGQTLRTLKKKGEALQLAAAFPFFFVTVLLGVSMSLGRFPAGGNTLPLHMMSGIVGWYTTLIILISPRLMSFFVSSRYKGLRKSGPGFLVLAGMAAALAGEALEAGGGFAASGGISAAGWILYLVGYAWVLVDLYRHFRHRRRREVEWVLKWILGGLYGGWPVAAAWAIASSGSLQANWAASGLLLSLFGFLQWNIGAYMAKILPFLRWMGRYGHHAAKDSSEQVPALHEMMPRKMTIAALTGSAAAAALLALGTGLGRGALTVSGAALGTAAWVLYGLALIIMYRR
ncbi:MAG: hypothetical protein AB2404_10860 [Planifilum fimeticola]